MIHLMPRNPKCQEDSLGLAGLLTLEPNSSCEEVEAGRESGECTGAAAHRREEPYDSGMMLIPCSSKASRITPGVFGSRPTSDVLNSSDKNEELVHLYESVCTLSKQLIQKSDDAEDLAHGFFVKLLERPRLLSVFQRGGKHWNNQSYLRACLRNYLRDTFTISRHYMLETECTQPGKRGVIDQHYPSTAYWSRPNRIDAVQDLAKTKEILLKNHRGSELLTVFSRLAELGKVRPSCKGTMPESSFRRIRKTLFSTLEKL